MDEVKPAARVPTVNIGSRVNREVHARFWERPEVRFLGDSTTEKPRRCDTDFCNKICDNRTLFKRTLDETAPLR